MKILRAADHRRMPWKNGGGVTWEIAVHPEGADLESFEWRVSVARVEVDGPFSTFPGVDRGFAVLEGEGVALTVGDAGPTEIRPGDPPFAFSADLAAAARLLGGPVADLNAMTRRAFWRQDLRRLELRAGEAFGLPDSGGVLLIHSGAATVAGESLGPLDALLAGEPLSLRALADTVAFAVALRRA